MSPDHPYDRRHADTPGGPMTTETETAFAELLDVVAATQARLTEQLADDRATLLEAHKWILSILQVAAEVNLWSDTARPRFVEIVGPYKKWGGDNADAFYCYAPDRPDPHLPGDRRTGRRRLPLPHGLRRPRRRPVLRADRGHRQQPRCRVAPDGTFNLVLSPDPPSEAGVAWIKLEPDAVAAITATTWRTRPPGCVPRGSIRGGRPTGHLPGGRRRPGPSHPGHDDLGARAGKHRPHATRHAQRHRPAVPRADNHLRLGRR